MIFLDNEQVKVLKTLLHFMPVDATEARLEIEPNKIKLSWRDDRHRLKEVTSQC